MRHGFRNPLTLWLLLGVTLPVHLACQTKGNTPRQTSRMEDSFREDVRIDFYGKVLDQWESPVVGAKVEIGVLHFAPNPLSFFMSVKTIHVKTNAKGEFSITNQHGKSLSVREIEAKGYEVISYAPRHSFEYRVGYIDEYGGHFRPDPKNPIIYHGRKKGEQTFVFESNGGPDFRFKQEESGAQKGIDIVQGLKIKEKDLPKPTFNGDPLFCDLKAKATFDAKTKTWTMVLTAGGDGGGILFSDRLLSEAPAEGYQPSYTIQPEAFRKAFGLTDSPERVEEKWGPRIQNPGIYLYLRSRTPGLYSRTHITHLVANKDEIYLSGGSTILNPYGDRNLEKATDIPGHVSVTLDNEVRESFRLNVNGRPPKPDLQKLTQEWEKRRPLTEKAKAWLK